MWMVHPKITPGISHNCEAIWWDMCETGSWMAFVYGFYIEIPLFNLLSSFNMDSNTDLLFNITEP